MNGDVRSAAMAADELLVAAASAPPDLVAAAGAQATFSS